MTILLKGSVGAEADALRAALIDVLGADAAGFPSLAQAGTPIDDDTVAAIKRWQAGVGLIADGIVGPRCRILLGLEMPLTAAMALSLSTGKVSRVFPATKPANIARYLPYVEAALAVQGLTDAPMILGALGTIRAETEGFVPIAEFQSRFNTPPGGAPFSLYDLRKDLGNARAGDGLRYRGRGFVQLTGKANYQTFGAQIGIDLVANPEWANAPEIAAVLLAQFLASKAAKFRVALGKSDFAAARKLVNGGSHGLAPFTDVCVQGRVVWADELRAVQPTMAPANTPRTSPRTHKDSRTHKDAADLRDRFFMPPPISLPDVFPPAVEIQRFLPAYTQAGLILSQGTEGASTGFGLSCVINYLRWVKADLPPRMESVSPRMLYTLASRHDEFDGENHEGASCRGALKGWFNHGVCLESDWPHEPGKSNTAKFGFAARAAGQTLGVYYRVDTRSITDVQAAIAQHRAVFVSAYTHAGWDQVPIAPLPSAHDDVPSIPFDGRRCDTDGHAFALVGFNARGFILQNAWGAAYGAGGFAVISYLDWLAHAMDAWVVSLGVPGVIAGRLAVTGAGSGTSAAQGGAGLSGLGGVDRRQWWDAGVAYRHSVVLGNDGRVARYVTEDEQPRKLMQQAYADPDGWFRATGHDRKRLLLYVHGGLNSENAAIDRARAMGRYVIGNGCYPIFLVWKTGLLESIGNLFRQAWPGNAPMAAGLGERISETTDRFLEKHVARPLAKPIWSEMKENADLAFADRRGGDLLLDALQALAMTWGDRFELHLVGHSAGSIAIGHLLSALTARKAAGRDGGLAGRVGTVQLLAPACSVAFANRHYAANPDVMSRLYLDILSDARERADNVGAVYRKSLLYLVSNALESDTHTPILGLQRIGDPDDAGWDGSSDTGDALKTWRDAVAASGLDQRTQVLGVDQVRTAVTDPDAPVMLDSAHGSFDNDVDVMTRAMQRVTGGGVLTMPIDDLRGF